MNPDTVEAALFGIEDKEGRINKIGALEEAHNGTLYLDEIADSSSGFQAKLLRAVELNEFQHVGGTKILKTDVRIIAVEPVGYGVQLVFSDGHARGIYPWAYLAELAATAIG